jgi:hypothetical protein
MESGKANNNARMIVSSATATSVRFWQLTDHMLN